MSALLTMQNACVALGGARVVDDVSFTVSPGEVVALLGANGAGKTSVLRAALGLVRLEAGRVELGGAEPRAMAAQERALRAGYLPQRPLAAWPVSVERLVALGRFAHGAAPDRLRDVDRIAVDAALAACALEELRKRRMDEISGGEKARAHLARALAQGAQLLMLDEPTVGLDPAQALGVADILNTHAEKGGGVVFSTHDVGLAVRASTRVLVMREGRTLAYGAARDVLTPDLLEAAYGRRGALHTHDGAVSAAFV